MKLSPFINLAINLRTAENGFIVEIADRNGEGTIEILFRTFVKAQSYIRDRLILLGYNHKDFIQNLERQKVNSLADDNK